MLSLREQALHIKTRPEDSCAAGSRAKQIFRYINAVM
jgi:hypothetical protein